MSNPTLRLAALAAITCLSALSAQAQTAFPTADAKVAPMQDSFYAPPADLAAATPGTVLRYRALPASSLWTDVKEGWQLMYRSTNSKNQPVAMVTTFLVPKTVSTTARSWCPTNRSTTA